MPVLCVTELPLVIFVPLHADQVASQESGVPTIVQARLVAPSEVNGPDGVAVRETEIAPTGVTVTEAVFEVHPAFVQVRV